MTVSITIDGIIFSLQNFGGISVYFAELIRYLQQQNEIDLRVDFFGRPNALGISDIKSSDNASFHGKRLLERYRKANCRNQKSVFHSSYYRQSKAHAMPSVVTVHDFYYERFRTGLPRLVHSLQKYSAIRTADAIICVSQATADDLAEFVGISPRQSLHIIHNGVGEAFTPSTQESYNSFQLLFVGARTDYKNFRTVLRALQKLPEHRLICIGGGAITQQELDGFSETEKRRIKHIPYVSDVELAGLYRTSLCLLYPSSFEGFGIPVAEAMKCGCPVIGLKSCTAVEEIAGSALVGINDNDPTLLAEAVESLHDSSFRSSVVQTGNKTAAAFSWSATHEKTLSVYRTLCDPK